MFVLIVMFVVFFSVAITSWWLDEFADSEDAGMIKPTPSCPQRVAGGRLAVGFGVTGK